MSEGGHAVASGLPLLALVSKVLLAFAVEFESRAEVSIAITANVLRQVGDEGIRVRDLPQRAGVSKEAIAVALSYLVKRGYAAVKPEAPGSRTKVLALSAKGREVRKTHLQLLATVEEGWQARFGEEVIDALRHSLEDTAPAINPLAPPGATGWRRSRLEWLKVTPQPERAAPRGPTTTARRVFIAFGGRPPAIRNSLEGVVGAGLFQGMEPYPDGWRASVPRPETLPQYPMVLHRGGYPDGS